MNNTQFSSLSLSESLLSVLSELGFSEMTPIQAKSIPYMLHGQDLIGQSHTGSGKTAAFALPILNKIEIKKGTIQALILCPTRELAAQVVREIRTLGRKIEGLKVLALTGGVSGKEQAQSIEKGLHIAVGTPGRVLDHINRDRIDLESITTLVLDEADKMLEMGFEDEIKAIMKVMPNKRQTLLFSATFPESVKGLSRQYQKNPITVEVEIDQESTAIIEQLVYDSEAADKSNTLIRILQQHPAESTLIFCNMKATANELLKKISELGASCAALHGDLTQHERDQAMAMFRNGSHRILIATDVAARGLDIENLEQVINYDLPQQAETYLHRIGRTGRAGRSGLAITIADKRDELRLLEFEKISGRKIERKPLGFKNQFGLSKNTRESTMKTLHISGGRRDKLRPGDILGALTGQPKGLQSTDIGKIEIHDKFSYVAISSQQAHSAIEKLRTGKIKGHKYQVKMMDEK